MTCTAKAHALELLKNHSISEGRRNLLEMQMEMIHNPPTCDICGKDGVQLNMIRDFRGNWFTTVCGKCHIGVDKLLNKLFHKYGGYIDEHGTILASCHGSPTIQSLEQLKQEVL